MHLLLGESDEPGIYWASSGGPRSLAGYPRVRHPVTDHVALRLSAAVGGGGRGAAGSARLFPTDPPVAPGLALGRACGRRSKAGQAPPGQGRPSQGGRARVRKPGCGTAIREPLRRGAPSRNSPPGRKPDSRYRPNGRSARPYTPRPRRRSAAQPPRHRFSQQISLSPITPGTKLPGPGHAPRETMRGAALPLPASMS
jgi:hypothetical protein